MINLLKSIFEQMGGCLFTTDTAGAEHGNLLLFIRTEFLFDILRPLPEGIGVRIFRSFKCSDLHFILVTGINHPDIRVPNQGVPFLRVYILTNCLIWIDRGIAQSDNFRTGNDSQTIKGRSGALCYAGLRSANLGSSRIWSRNLSIPSCGPEMVALIPSGARIMVPRMFNSFPHCPSLFFQSLNSGNSANL